VPLAAKSTFLPPPQRQPGDSTVFSGADAPVPSPSEAAVVTPKNGNDVSTVCWDVMIEDVLFETDSAEVTGASLELLNNVLAQWKGRRDIALEVRGHTDSIASDLYNIRLSARRSRMVRDFLLERGGFVPEQVIESSYGESQPRDSNETADGRARNRRVAIRISGAFCKDGALPSKSAQPVTGGH
jgi:outer membrane protein OmpA-like peptidoglycan-associated protein